MGFRFTTGRIILWLLMILQGILIIQSGFKDQRNQMHELRSYLNKHYYNKNDTGSIIT